jgi:hypothetical protein
MVSAHEAPTFTKVGGYWISLGTAIDDIRALPGRLPASTRLPATWPCASTATTWTGY